MVLVFAIISTTSAWVGEGIRGTRWRQLLRMMSLERQRLSGLMDYEEVELLCGFDSLNRKYE
jgi:hypothetical protein